MDAVDIFLLIFIVCSATTSFALFVKRTKRKAREVEAMAARGSTPEPEPVPEPTLEPAPTPEPVPEPAPVGQWREIDDGLDVEFEYLDENGERSSVELLVYAVCDSHFSGVSLNLKDGPEDVIFAFSRVTGRVCFSLEDDETDAEGMRRRLLASADAVAGAPADEPDPEPQAAPASGNLLFEYEDSRGKISTREISNWTVSGNKLRGYCLDREAVRTFRLDRITRVIEGAALLEASRHAPARPMTAPSEAKRKSAPEILFSGFDSQSRLVLESMAESHGFRVRKTVTKNLDVLVRGPRPSQSKLADAKGKLGCSVVDKEGFLWMVTTGEIPA